MRERKETETKHRESHGSQTEPERMTDIKTN